MPITHVHTVTKFPTKSPVIDPISVHLDYFNTFTTADASDVGDLINTLATAWNAVPSGGSSAPTNYLGQVLDRSTNMASITAYDVTGHLDGSRHGSFTAQKSFTVGAGGTGAGVPEGVALVIT